MKEKKYSKLNRAKTGITVYTFVLLLAMTAGYWTKFKVPIYFKRGNKPFLNISEMFSSINSNVEKIKFIYPNSTELSRFSFSLVL